MPLDLVGDESLTSEPEVANPARPTNYKRSFFHVLSGLFALGLIVLLPGRSWLIGASGAFMLFAWTCEISRRRSERVNAILMRLFAPVAHPQEAYEVNSSTWYVSALFLMALFAPMRAAELGVIVLAFADPAAGLIGRRFGRTRIRTGRSLEGTLAFVGAGTLAAGTWLVLHHGASLGTAALIAGAGAVVGALAEIVVTKLDDNFAIPVAATTAVAVAQLLV
jgi:dolichol kinase